MAWELDNNRSIYGQIIEIIQKRIVTGEYEAGSKMASVRDLAQEAGVNPNTMQRALSELERTGIINTQRTSGRYVTDDLGKIGELREQLAGETVDKLFKEMGELGYSNQEIQAFLKRRNV